MPNMDLRDPNAVSEAIQGKIALMIEKMKTLQNPDGGFKAFYCHDRTSGVWATAEITHMAAKVSAATDPEWLHSGCRYLIKSQNSDGGWPFRRKGKSITDITAWCVLALSHFDLNDAILNGIKFILHARNNEGTVENEDGWGLTSFEQDRVYSTWIASYCIQRVLATHGDALLPATVDEMRTALAESRQWLIRMLNPDGSWPPTSGAAPHVTSTAVPLLTLFLQGEDPERFANSSAGPTTLSFP